MELCLGRRTFSQTTKQDAAASQKKHHRCGRCGTVQASEKKQLEKQAYTTSNVNPTFFSLARARADDMHQFTHIFTKTCVRARSAVHSRIYRLYTNYSHHISRAVGTSHTASCLAEATHISAPRIYTTRLRRRRRRPNMRRTRESNTRREWFAVYYIYTFGDRDGGWRVNVWRSRAKWLMERARERWVIHICILNIPAANNAVVMYFDSPKTNDTTRGTGRERGEHFTYIWMVRWKTNNKISAWGMCLFRDVICYIQNGLAGGWA